MQTQTPPSPPGTPTRFNTYAPPPSVVKKHERRNENKMDNAIEIIVGMRENGNAIDDIRQFGQKLINKKTKYFNRANQSSTTRVYIDDHDVNPRFVYKLGTYSKMKREIENYEKLEIIDDAREHILRRVGGLIEIPGTDVAMFITLYKDGLTSDNLLYNPDKTTFSEDDEQLAVQAEEYLKLAGLEHDDIAGNLYVIDKTFFWIDFEEMKGQSSWFQFNPFSPTKRLRPEDSPPHNTSTEASTSSSGDVSPVSEVSASSIDHMPYPPYPGGSRKKRSRKSKKHKRKSNKRKSNKRKSKRHKHK